MLTLLLAEDEFETRSGLKTFIEQNISGIDLIKAAENGLSAINLCESIHTDILLTDVRMPKMNGIELATYVRERFPDCRIIFLSGFSDKEYLFSAIKLGAINYLEKPVDFDELSAELNTAVNSIQSDLTKKEKEMLLNSFLIKNNARLLEKAAIEGVYKPIDASLLKELHPKFGKVISTSYSACSVFITLHEVFPLVMEEKEYFQSEILEHLFENLDISSSSAVVSGFSGSNTLVMHFIFNHSSIQQDIFTAVKNMLKSLSGKFQSKYIFSSCIGPEVSDIAELHLSAGSAMQLQYRHFYLHKGCTVYDIDTTKSVYTFDDAGYLHFQQLLLDNNENRVVDFLNELCRSVVEFSSTDIGYIKNIYFKLFLIITQTAESRNIKDLMLESEDTYIWQEISKMQNIYDITEYLKSTVKEYFAVQNHKDGTEKQIHEILIYIENNYAYQNLSIKSIAEYAHYDHYYICTLFKKHTGKTLNDHITQIRIEKAKELLKDRNIKLYDITGMVGYVDPSYFSKIFKKYNGMNPSEYRERYLL